MKRRRETTEDDRFDIAIGGMIVAYVLFMFVCEIVKAWT